MKNYLSILALGIIFLLSGSEDVKSSDWWQSHPNEAEKKVAECKSSGSDSDNCKNAKDGLFRYKQLKAVDNPIDYKDAFGKLLDKGDKK